MARENYKDALSIILDHEGGYVNHPKDPGGITNMGVTKRTYEEWIGHEVDADTMKALTEDDVAPIYEKNYWGRVHGDNLPAGLDLCVFDFGVNAGTGRAARYLQELVGAGVDGAIGPNTISKVDEFVTENGVEVAIREYQDARQGYYESLSTFETFGRGWTRRVHETTNIALNMI